MTAPVLQGNLGRPCHRVGYEHLTSAFMKEDLGLHLLANVVVVLTEQNMIYNLSNALHEIARLLGAFNASIV